MTMVSGEVSHVDPMVQSAFEQREIVGWHTWHRGQYDIQNNAPTKHWEVSRIPTPRGPLLAARFVVDADVDTELPRMYHTPNKDVPGEGYEYAKDLIQVLGYRNLTVETEGGLSGVTTAPTPNYANQTLEDVFDKKPGEDAVRLAYYDQGDGRYPLGVMFDNLADGVALLADPTTEEFHHDHYIHALGYMTFGPRFIAEIKRYAQWYKEIVECTNEARGYPYSFVPLGRSVDDFSNSLRGEIIQPMERFRYSHILDKRDAVQELVSPRKAGLLRLLLRSAILQDTRANIRQMRKTATEYGRSGATF